MHALSIEEIKARLNDRFRLLTGGNRTALPRQQTLRATLDWSYDLLDGDERSVLGRVAIFAGGFTLEAASSVASDETIDEFAVTDLLSHLVARSLVVAETTGSGSRYRLLETARTYALAKLAATGESERIARRHARYFRDKVRARGRRLDEHARRGLARYLSARARQRARSARVGAASRRRSARSASHSPARRGRSGRSCRSMARAIAGSKPPPRISMPTRRQRTRRDSGSGWD